MIIQNTACSRVSDRKPLQPDEGTKETVVSLPYQYCQGPKYVKPAKKRLDSDLLWYHSSVLNDHLLIELLAKKTYSVVKRRLFPNPCFESDKVGGNIANFRKFPTSL